MVTRVATFTSHTLLSNLALSNASKYTELSNQAASGYKSRSYSGIANDAQQLLNLEGSLTRNDQYLNNITQVKLRLQNMESATDSMSDIATRMKTLLLQGLSNSQADDLNIDEEARQALNQVQSLLNSTLDGRFLFGGATTDTAPVSFDNTPVPDTYFAKFTGSDTATLDSLGVSTAGSLDINGQTVTYSPTDTIKDLANQINQLSPPPAIATVRQDPDSNNYRLVIEDFSGNAMSIAETGGGNLLDGLSHNPALSAETGYYQGDQKRLAARVDEEYSVNYGVRADDPAFASLIASLRIVSTTTDEDSLKMALGHINFAIENLPNVTSKIGIDVKNVETIETQHQDFAVFANNAISDIENVDVPLTLAELEQYNTALQASFLTISKSSENSLVNYLR
ncbi:flagellar hook-associated protein FlgL [Thalassospira marina]|uniref:Flagellar hook-associated protein 3 n=1 Tax=Thalassospira marina TaxID=2048283 RepID=A0ABM6Q696_9PROT|nr:flagellar hook-associated protein FlgL [Thalassospira marina]AUG51995.1 flagellar hook-associated protein 3 [Thalassospira marina]